MAEAGAFEGLLRAFTREVQRSGVLKEYRRRRYFVSQAERRRREAREAARRARRQARREG